MSDDSVETLNESTASASPSHVLPLDNFHQWINCFCVVAFDLELGQVIEKIFPEHCYLSDIERTNICYLAFPDSNTGCMDDTSFHFRIRSPLNAQKSLSDDIDYHHLTGYVLFRQVKDPSIKRGYFQKSVVLLSRLPYVDLFLNLVRKIGPEFFENGDIALETVCYQIDKWPTPYPDCSLQLPIMGYVMEITIPSSSLSIKAWSSSISELQCCYQPKLYQCFQAMLPHLHLLWELVLLGEPIVVIAPNPTLCSEGVQSLVSLIQPLRYMCDYRPYFTIHDSELKEYTSQSHSPASVILGVTNPFFVKTLQQWPHIIRIGEMPSLISTKMGRKTQNLKPGIYTKHKPCLNRDKAVLRRVEKGLNGTRPVEVQNAMLCKCINELMQSFMIPLERYIGSLMPLQRSILPWKSPPKLRKFNADEFIATLSNYGPQLTSKLKGNWTELYRKFFRSPNFEAWFRKKRREVNNKLEILHLETLCQADIVKWVKGKNEVEIVDLYMYLKNKLLQSKTSPVYISCEIRHELHSQLELVLKALPTDLQEVLKKNL